MTVNDLEMQDILEQGIIPAKRNEGWFERYFDMCQCTLSFVYLLAVRTLCSYGLLDVVGVQCLVLQVRLAFKQQLTRRVRCITGWRRPLNASQDRAKAVTGERRHCKAGHGRRASSPLNE
jgi:hypothetical protein